MHIFVCEDSIDGIFSGIYRAYDSRLGHSNIRLITGNSLDTYELFCEYEEVPVNSLHSQKVADTLRKRLGQEAFSAICHAMAACEASGKQKNIHKAEAVYKTVVLALSQKEGHKILDYIGNPYVQRVFELGRSAGNEAHHFMGFLRFQELANGILFSRIHPKHDILPLLAAHFTDRLPMEDFIIYDETRKTAALHKSGSGYLLSSVSQVNTKFINNFSEKELEYQQLWVNFFHSITIDERRNPKLQSQNIPKRFWKDSPVY